MDGNIDLVSKPGDVLIGSPGDVHNLWNKTREKFMLAVFTMDLPEEGEEGRWYE